MADTPFDRVRKQVAGAPSGATGALPGKSKGRQATADPSAAPPPPAHPTLGKASAIWPYHNAAGGLLGYVMRFDTRAGKEIRPLTWRDAGGGPAWAWEGFDAPRPLYRLAALADRPADAVLVVEGEKTADAAAERLPGFVAVTWPGGAKAVGKADFGPLAGRRVIVWPDADDAGRDAAKAVVRAARAAGAASVAVVRLPSGLEPGWDLADDWPAGFGQSEAEAAIVAASGAAGAPAIPTPAPDVAGVTWPPGFRMDPSSGLWCEARDAEGGRAQWISDPFDVIGEGRNLRGEDWSVVVRVKARDGRVRTLFLRRSGIGSGGGDARKALSDAGLTFHTGQGMIGKLMYALMRVRAPGFVQLTEVTGWHDGRFVLPDVTIGPQGGEAVFFTGEATSLKYATRGDFESWKRMVAARAVGNPLLMFALSCGFAAPLLRLLEAEGGGFHFRGSSSSGKSTLLAAAGSIYGGDPNGGQQGFSHTWRSTANALESLAKAHNDVLLCLDELKELGARDAGAAAYALANGEGKKRLTADSSLRPAARWLLFFLSSGEISLADHVASDGVGGRVAAGQELRLLDIAADGGRDMGIWAAVADDETPARRSEALKAAAKAHFGHAGPRFLEKLIANREPLLGDLREHMADFRSEVRCEDDSGQIARAVERFALIAAAGELASGLGVVPWDLGDATAAVRTVFERWATAFGRVGLREDRQAVECVKAYIETHRSSFATMHDADEGAPPAKTVREDESRSMLTVGFRFVRGKEVFFLFTKSGLAEVLKGFYFKDATKALDRANFLETDKEPGRLTKRKSFEGQKLYFYWVRAAILELDDG